MDGYGSGRDYTKRRRRCMSAEVAQLWGPAAAGVRTPRARGPPPRLLRFLYRGSLAVGTSSSWLTPVKIEPKELPPLAIKLEADTDPPRRGVISPKDYFPPGAGGPARTRHHGALGEGGGGGRRVPPP